MRTSSNERGSWLCGRKFRYRDVSWLVATWILTCVPCAQTEAGVGDDGPRVEFPDAVGWAFHEREADNCRQRFVRADIDQNTWIEVSDVIFLLGYLFLDGRVPGCLRSADTNDDDVLDLSDPVFLLRHLFVSGQDIPAPWPLCGFEIGTRTLGCETYRPCPIVLADEICDELDNDCDGEIDEGFDLSVVERCGACDRDCTQQDWENVASYACVDGACAIEACEDGFFDVDGIAENGCETDVPPNGMPCDDGNPCTEDDQYWSGFCSGFPKDCSELVDICNFVACDPETGECYRIPRPRRPCDDGDPGTLADQCTEAGECVGRRFPFEEEPLIGPEENPEKGAGKN